MNPTQSGTPAPYYQDDRVTIYHSDCRAILPLLEADAVVTDPPYGIKADKRQQQRAGKQHGKALAPSRDYGHSDWDQAPPTAEDIARLRSIGTQHIVWGGNYFDLPPAAGWLVWDKQTGSNGYADAELAWTDLPIVVRMFSFQWMGMLQALPEERYHPTQKPLSVMRWCMSLLAGSSRVILDPYMGSGTTLRAAKDFGRKAIGIDAEERYCEIAARRMGQEALDLAA